MAVPGSLFARKNDCAGIRDRSRHPFHLSLRTRFKGKLHSLE